MTEDCSHAESMLRRLEAATSRLEDIASSATGADVSSTAEDAIGQSTSKAVGGGTTAGSRGAAISNAVNGLASKSAVNEGLPEAINAFGSLIQGEVKAFKELSEQLGGAIAEQVSISLKRDIWEVEKPGF